VAAALLALMPAGALAQSAGDEQYEDPFGDQAPPAQATPEAAPAPAAEPAPAPAAPAPAAPTQPAPAPAAQPVQAGQAELPRTGGDARIPPGLGLVLLAAGVALRAHARRAP